MFGTFFRFSDFPQFYRRKWKRQGSIPWHDTWEAELMNFKKVFKKWVQQIHCFSNQFRISCWHKKKVARCKWPYQKSSETGQFVLSRDSLSEWDSVDPMGFSVVVFPQRHLRFQKSICSQFSRLRVQFPDAPLEKPKEGTFKYIRAKNASLAWNMASRSFAQFAFQSIPRPMENVAKLNSGVEFHVSPFRSWKSLRVNKTEGKTASM